MDELLVYHCAPTLAGIKGAALLCVPKDVSDDYEGLIKEYNDRYNRRGLYFRTLGQCKGRYLLYMYRPALIAAHVQHPDCRAFLATYGYEDGPLEWLLQTLTNRFSQREDFPHELGLFLAYPLADVKAFIEHGGQGAKLCGEWKVYTDVPFAKREFSKYHICRSCYMDMFNRGFTVDELILA